jgi:hypothetical protein
MSASNKNNILNIIESSLICNESSSVKIITAELIKQHRQRWLDHNIIRRALVYYLLLNLIKNCSIQAHAFHSVGEPETNQLFASSKNEFSIYRLSHSKDSHNLFPNAFSRASRVHVSRRRLKHRKKSAHFEQSQTNITRNIDIDKNKNDENNELNLPCHIIPNVNQVSRFYFLFKLKQKKVAF